LVEPQYVPNTPARVAQVTGCVQRPGCFVIRR
jgi:hypothetical protein